MDIMDVLTGKEGEESEIRRLTLEKLKKEQIEEFRTQQKKAEMPIFSWGDIKIYPDGGTSLERPRSIDTESMTFKIFKAFGDSDEDFPIIKFKDFKEKKSKVKQTIADIRRYYKPEMDIFQSVRGVGYRLKNLN